jgi:hypothetical protein
MFSHRRKDKFTCGFQRQFECYFAIMAAGNFELYDLQLVVIEKEST